MKQYVYNPHDDTWVTPREEPSIGEVIEVVLPETTIHVRCIVSREKNCCGSCFASAYVGMFKYICTKLKCLNYSRKDRTSVQYILVDEVNNNSSN